MYINNQGHMTKMATMPIYGINPSKIFSGTGTIFYNICIYSRSQVRVYRTIGPLVQVAPMIMWYVL